MSLGILFSIQDISFDVMCMICNYKITVYFGEFSGVDTDM